MRSAGALQPRLATHSCPLVLPRQRAAAQCTSRACCRLVWQPQAAASAQPATQQAAAAVEVLDLPSSSSSSSRLAELATVQQQTPAEAPRWQRFARKLLAGLGVGLACAALVR